MAASFLALSRTDMFYSGGAATYLLGIPAVDALLSNVGLALYDSVTLQIGETIQYFLTFDDVIKYIHFGKGVGTITVEGTMFSDCDGYLPGFAIFNNGVSALRGKTQVVSLGGRAFTVIMTNAAINVVGEPLTSAKFTFTFSIVNHSL
jgi:hypothetical protein